MIKILDTLYHDRHYARFFVLETIARVPYFGECLSFFISSTGLSPLEGSHDFFGKIFKCLDIKDVSNRS